MQNNSTVYDLVHKVMKVSIIQMTLAMAFCCLAMANDNFAQEILDREVTLDLKEITLKKALGQIAKASRVKFVYSCDRVMLDERISLQASGKKLGEVLEMLLPSRGITYKVQDDNDHIVLMAARPSQGSLERPEPNEETQDLVTETPLAYALTVTGNVTSSHDNSPLPGVSVVVKGTTTGTTTDAEGNYSIALEDDNGILVFSFIGYTTQEIAVASQTTLDVSLVEDVTQLGEVVVVGYGEKRREQLTGAVGTITSDVLESRPITNTMAAIQGAMPGLIVQRSSGQPGAEDFKINVRGFSSIGGGNSPLILIDGIAGSLDLLNPADIESISVLKDASASIYGARAANGVFIVTTKKGKRGAPKITYSSNVAISKLAGMMETPNHYQMAVMDNEANIHNGSAPMYTPDLLERVRIGDPNPIPHPVYGGSGWMLFFTSTDWRKAVFENGFQHKHTVNVSGGGTNASYYLSASYADQEGVIRDANDNNKRYNLRMNYDYDFSKRIHLETKLSLENQKRSDVGGVGTYLITESIFGMPNHPVYTQSGNKYFAQGGWGNAVTMAKEGATATFNTRNITTNFKLIGDLADGLKLNFQSGINYSTRNDKDIGNSFPLYTWDESSIAYYSIANPDQTWMTQYNSENIYRNFTAYLQYAKVFGDNHELDIMGGASHEENDFDWFEAERSKFLTDDLWVLGLGSTDNMKNDGGGEHWAIGSFFSRISYVFNNKYMVEANLRYDGSSRFQKSTRWGLFPGVSVGWRLSEENFIRDLGLFDNLKLRASYGETGNQDVVGLYDYYQLINVGRSTPYPFGAGQQDQSAYLSGVVSLDRTWETVATTNIGLDATMLSSKLDFSFDYFVKRNKNMLIPVSYPSLLGAKPPASNAGELKTWGFETSLAWKDKIGSLEYSARVILSDAQNEMVNFGGQDTYQLGLNGLVSADRPPREGYPINTYFAYQFDGIIRTQEELDAYKELGGVPSDIDIGDARYKDINGDGKISLYSDTPGEDGDVINAGNTSPRYTYGLNLNLKWKNFDFGIFLQGVGERTLFREGEYSIPWSDWWRQPPTFYYQKTWNEDRPNAEYPRLSHGNIRNWNYQPSTLQAINAAYLRLKNVQVGYSLPEALISKVSLSRARIYFSGFDLLEIHNVKGGWDPESSSSGFNYPFQRLYSLGIDITF